MDIILYYYYDIIIFMILYFKKYYKIFLLKCINFLFYKMSTNILNIFQKNSHYLWGAFNYLLVNKIKYK